MTIKTYLNLTLLFSLALLSCKNDDNAEAPPEALDTSFEINLGGTQDDIANALLILNNELYAFGSTESFSDPNGDYFLVKTDLLGNVIYEKTYGGGAKDEGRSILATSDGNLILLGVTESFGNGMNDIYLIKIDPNGTVLWEKTFGGNLDDDANKMIETSNSEYCIAGTTESFGPGPRNMYTLWIDQEGELIRETTYGSNVLEGSSGILEIENNDIMIYGYTQSAGASSRDFFLQRINSLGAPLWSQTYGGNGYEESQGFTRSESGGFIINGHSASTDPLHNMYGIKLDIDGAIIWERNFGGFEHDGGQHVFINSDGNYVFMGRSSSFSFGNGNTNIYLAITDSEGNLLDQYVLNDAEDYWGQDMLEHDLYYYIVGRTTTNALGGDDFYIRKLKK